jgi:phosphatidylinositol dimannoside acyltransferase
VPASKRPPDEGRLIQVVYYAYVGASRLAQAIPERLAYGIAHTTGTLMAKLSRKKRAIVERNISRITGEPPDSIRVQSLVVAAFKSYARYWLETFRLVRAPREFFLERFQCPDEYKLDEMAARGKGAVVAVGHLGNWDAAGAWVGARGQRLVSVAEMLKPRRMFEFFADHRARLGMKIYGAESGVTAKLVEEVERGSIVAILGDRDLKGVGPKVEFFGEPTTFPAGPASVALRAGVPLLVGGVFSIVLGDGRRGWYTEISGPFELPEEKGPGAVQQLTEIVASELERFIARRPEEWHVFQAFWPEDRARA